MKAVLNNQLDLFEGKISLEVIHGEKIRLLEEKQEKLRKGLFRRWNDQEEKIKEFSKTLSQLLVLLEKEIK